MDELRRKVVEIIERYTQSPQQDILDDPDQWYWDFASDILEAVREEGYVKLAKDQSEPDNPYFDGEDNLEPEYSAYEQAVDDMLKSGFRRVEL